MDCEKSLKTYYGFIFIKKGNGKICGRYPLTKKECSFGRDVNCDIRICLETVSAHHCSILFVDDKAYIRDKSTAGSTKVNGKKIGRNNFLLHHADEIDISSRKFVWEYAKSYIEPNYLSGKKSCTRMCFTSSTESKHSNQVNKPLVPKNDNKMTPVKTPSKILLSINKTPIIVAGSNMSKSSFDVLKNNLQKQNSSVTSQTDHQIMKSLAMVPGRNIPLFGDPKVTQRKSWVVTPTPNNPSSSGVHILNRLSCERLKRDSTPEFNSSYHYADENVEFDSPEPPNIMVNYEHPVQSSALDEEEDTVNNDVPSKANIDDLHFTNSFNLSNTELEPNTSRRDTYSIDDIPTIVPEQNTPVPRRSILKCSKTANRSRSSCRKVQFARLPNTDGGIKVSKSRFNSGSNFIVSNDKVNETNYSDNSKKCTLFDAEEFDDDLDGVQPLDNSVSSLMNSPILNISSINKSSKRGSRGNKVMSLVNSIEKRTNESSIHSIRASDLLSMSGSKHENTSSETNTTISQISSRRINLEEIFEAEDSLKNVSCSIENQTIVQETDGNLVKQLENNSDLQKLPHNHHESSSDHADDDNIQVDCSKYFENTIKSKVSTINDTTSINVSENINEVSTTVEKEISTIGGEVENSSKHEELSTVEKEMSTINDETSINVSENINEVPTTVEKEISTIGGEVENSSKHEELSTVEKEMSTINDETSINVSENINEVPTTVEKEISTIGGELENNNSKHVEELSAVEKEISTINDETLIVSENINEVSTTVEKEISTIDDELVAVDKEISSVNAETLTVSENINEVSITVDKEISTIGDELKNNSSEHTEKLRAVKISNVLKGSSEYFGIEKDNLDVQNNVSKLSKRSVNKEKDYSEDAVNTSGKKRKHLDVENVSEIVKQLINVTKTCSNSLNNMSVPVEQPSDESTSLIAPCVSEVSNSNIDKLGTIYVQHKEHLIENNLLLEKYLPKSLRTNESCSRNNTSTETINVDIMNTVEMQLHKIHSNKSTISNFNERETIYDGSMSSIDNDKETQLSRCDLSETIGLDNLFNNKDGNDSLNSIQKKTSTLNESKLSSMTKNSIHQEKSNSKKIASVDLQNSGNCSNKTCLSTGYKDLEHKTHTDLEHTLDLSIGKPRYESTPWNGSKSSKSIQLNLNNDVSENTNQQRTRSRSTTPLNDPDWSQMMKDFNESVKKASSKQRHDLHMCNKIVYNQQSSKCKTAFQVTNSLNISIFKKTNIVKPENVSSNSKTTRNKEKIVCQALPKDLITIDSDSENEKSSIKSSNVSRKSRTTRNKKKLVSQALPIDLITTDSDSENEKSSLKPANVSSSSRTTRNKKKLVSQALPIDLITTESDTENEKSSIKPANVSSSSRTTRNKKKLVSLALPKDLITTDSERENEKSPIKSSNVSSSSRITRNKEKLVSQVLSKDLKTTDSERENEKSPIKSSNVFSKSRTTRNKEKIVSQVLPKDLITTESDSENEKSSLKPANVSSSSRTIRNKNKLLSQALPKDLITTDSHSENEKSSLKLANVSSSSRTTRNKKKLVSQALPKDLITTDSERENVKSPIKSSNTSSKSRTTRNKEKIVSQALPKVVITIDSERENEKGPIKSSNVSSKSRTTRNKNKLVSQALPKDLITTDSDSENEKSSTKSSNVTSKNKKESVCQALPKNLSTSSYGSENISNSGKNSFKSCVSSESKKRSSLTSRQTRRNLRTRININESNKSVKKHTRSNPIIAKERSSIDNNSEGLCSSKSIDVLHTAVKKESTLSNKSVVKDTISIKPKRINSNIEKYSSKIKITEKSQRIKSRITRSNTTLTESSLPQFDKKNQTSSPVKRKSSEVGKTKKISKSTKLNKKSRAKRILPSEPIHKYTSEYESSDEEENIENLHLDNSSTTNNGKHIHCDNNSSSLSTKRNLRERVSETSNVTTQLSTQSRKRNADVSHFSQPIAKSKKCASSSKVVNTTISSENYLPSNTKRTRQMSKLTAVQDFDDSINDTKTPADTKKMKKPKSNEKTRAKKREYYSEDNSHDLAPSSSKITRKGTVNVPETEIKKSTRSTSKNSNTDEAWTKVKFDKSTKQAVSQEKYSSPTHRVLRPRK